MKWYQWMCRKEPRKSPIVAIKPWSAINDDQKSMQHKFRKYAMRQRISKWLFGMVCTRSVPWYIPSSLYHTSFGILLTKYNPFQFVQFLLCLNLKWATRKIAIKNGIIVILQKDSAKISNCNDRKRRNNSYDLAILSTFHIRIFARGSCFKWMECKMRNSHRIV